MSEKHTQGPWRVALDPSHPAEYAIDATVNGEIRHIALVHIVGSDDETEANAKVLAAAPELLKALQESNRVLSALSHVTGDIVRAVCANDAALTKAT